MRSTLLVAGLLWAAGAVLADDVTDAADQALALYRAGDREGLDELVKPDSADIWLVAQELRQRGELDAAVALVRAARVADGDHLLAYLESRRGKPADEAFPGIWASYHEATKAKRFDRALVIAEGHESLDEVNAIHLLNMRGTALSGMRRYEEAAKAYGEAARRAQALGWRTHTLAATYHEGLCHAQLARFDEARTVWGRQLALAEKWKRKDRASAAHINLAACCRRLGRFDEAREHLEKAIAAKEELGDRGGLARAYSQLGTLRLDRGDVEGARDCYEKALPIDRELGNRRGVAQALNNLGILHRRLGDHERALQLYGESLEIKKEIGDRKGIATTLDNIAGIHRSLGDYPKALASEVRALAEFQELRATEDVLRVTLNVGLMYRLLGEYGRAAEFMERALRLARERRLPLEESRALSGLGLVRLGAGDFSEALSLLEAALEIDREHGNPRLEAFGLNNLGLVYKELRQLDRALELFRASLARKQATGDRLGVANSLANIAICLQIQGDLAGSLAEREKALALFEELGNPSGAARARGEIATLHRQLGEVERALAGHEASYRELRDLGDRVNAGRALYHVGLDLWLLGRREEARAREEEALAIAEELDLGADRVDCLKALAEADLADGDPRAALARARRGLGELAHVTGGLSEERAAAAREPWAELSDIGVQAALALGDHAEVCWFLESGRAGVLLESLGGRDALRATAVPEGLRTEEAEARGAEARALALYRRSLEGGDRAQVRERRAALEEARGRVADLVAKIQREAKAAAQVIYPEPDALETIRARLRKNEALVLYAPPGALVVTAAGARVADLGEMPQGGWTFDDPAVDPAAAIEQLRAAVAAPLGLDEKITRVLVSPAGSLSYVPFVLAFPGREVTYMPSGTTYGVLLRERAARGEQVLALGDPKYGTRGAPVEAQQRTGDESLAPLPGTRAEAKAVGDVVLLGDQASETRFLEAVAARPRWRAVHLACHGRVDPERAILSSLALTSDEKNDGFLTALDVFRLRIPADLVVLSACQTARGKVYRAEGVVGLTRAFMFAGSPRVIASAWKVDDEATRALMVKFYELWKPGETPTATALAKAQEHVRSREEWRHPAYWAAWQLWGLPD